MVRWFVGTVAPGLVALGFWQIVYTHSIYPDSLLSRIEAGWWGAGLIFVGFLGLFMVLANAIRRLS